MKLFHSAFKFFPQAPEEVQEKKKTAVSQNDSNQNKAQIILGYQALQAEMANGQKAGKPQPVQVEEKIGRNDPCPCGSGKKYKHCHGK